MPPAKPVSPNNKASLSPERLVALHEAHADGLFRYFWAGSGDWGHAEDLVQDFFVKLARQGSLPAVLRCERTWIFTVARNLLLDWQRFHSRRPVLVADSATCETQPELAPAAEPDAALLTENMLKALASLPVELRIVAQLRLWEGMTLKEIAETQGEPLPTIASRWKTAQLRLQSILQPIYSEFIPPS